MEHNLTPLSFAKRGEADKMDHLEEIKQIQETLQQIAAEAVRLREELQRIQMKLRSSLPPRLNSEQRALC
jgi:hypothetical protein